MIQGHNILGRVDNPIKVRMVKGFIVPSDSDIGISWERIFEERYPVRFPQKMSIRKPRSKFYLEYTDTTYKVGASHYDLVTRVEYKLPSGELVYVNDCDDRDQDCERKNFLRAFEIFKQHGGSRRLNEKPMKVFYERDEAADKFQKYLDGMRNEKISEKRTDVLQLERVKKFGKAKPKRKPVKKCYCKKK